MLTPIKIPRKNKRDQSKSALAARHDSPTKRRFLGRPSKSLTPSTASSRSTTPSRPRSYRSLKNLKSKGKMSALEKLPVEILQTIFILSLNCELPRASPIIGGKLTSKHAYLQALFAAFQETWDERCLAIKDEDVVAMKWKQEPSAGDPKAQSALLCCRWASLEILRWAEDKYLWERTQKKVPNRAEATIRSTSPTAEVHICRWRDKTTDDQFDTDFQEFFITTGVLGDENAVDILRPPFQWDGLLKIHPKTSIPESLLRGPWTEEMVKHLFWFLRAGAKIDWIGSTSGEVAMDGLQQALASDNLHVLYILDCLEVTTHLEIPLVVDTAIAYIETGIDAGSFTLKLAIMTRLMSMLKRDGSCEITIEVFGPYIDGPIRRAAARYEFSNPESRGESGPVAWVQKMRWRWTVIKDRRPTPV